MTPDPDRDAAVRLAADLLDLYVDTLNALGLDGTGPIGEATSAAVRAANAAGAGNEEIYRARRNRKDR
jgi:hypothetical protein